jgi:hypothetical protein
MSAKPSKKSILSLIFRKTYKKHTNVVKPDNIKCQSLDKPFGLCLQTFSTAEPELAATPTGVALHGTKTIAVSEKSKMTYSQVELLNKYYIHESIITTLYTVEHVRRLSQEKSCVSDLEDMVITSGDSILLGLLNRWSKSVKNSIQNLDETLESYYSENIEPKACFHLNRSIVHLVNLYETLSEMSKLSEETYERTMYSYLNTIAKCLTDFRTDFNKYCSEISNYISDFKQTLTLLINRHPENRLVIHAMGDIERLYNHASEMVNNINTSTPIEIDVSIGYMDRLSNDINDIKSDLINVNTHQDKDNKDVNSSYV